MGHDARPAFLVPLRRDVGDRLLRLLDGIGVTGEIDVGLGAHQKREDRDVALEPFAAAGDAEFYHRQSGHQWVALGKLVEVHLALVAATDVVFEAVEAGEELVITLELGVGRAQRHELGRRNLLEPGGLLLADAFQLLVAAGHQGGIALAVGYRR